MKTSLQKAAKNLIDRWASPFWKDQKGTAHFVKELEKALDLELQFPLQAFDIELILFLRTISQVPKEFTVRIQGLVNFLKYHSHLVF